MSLIYSFFLWILCTMLVNGKNARRLVDLVCVKLCLTFTFILLTFSFSESLHRRRKSAEEEGLSSCLYSNWDSFTIHRTKGLRGRQITVKGFISFCSRSRKEWGRISWEEEWGGRVRRKSKEEERGGRERGRGREREKQQVENFTFEFPTVNYRPWALITLMQTLQPSRWQ